MQRWLEHTAFTDPGPHAQALSTLGSDPARAMAAIQGLLIHGGALEHYGVAAQAYDRRTLAIGPRLSAILAADERPLDVARAPERRAVGTCRDYALLLCSLMRTQGVAARVRCGFATYLSAAPWEDHWICEVEDPRRWRQLDAQLDEVMRATLSISFDPADIPSHAFLTADEAWRRCRSGRLDPSQLGHGEARGLWFALVNLMRDRLALSERPTSAWDSWRDVAANPPTPTEELLALADRIADDDRWLAPLVPWWTRTPHALLRPYREGDAPAMAQLYYDSVRALGPLGYASEQVVAWAPAPPSPAAFRARASDGRMTLVAENAWGEIVAYGDLEEDGHIDHLYCRPDVAGTGVASWLVEELVARAEATGVPRVFVEASELARQLFERKGFGLVQRRDFAVRGVPIHNYAMEKTLRQ